MSRASLPLLSFRFGLFITASYFSLAITEDDRLPILSFVVFPMVTGFVSLGIEYNVY